MCFIYQLVSLVTSFLQAFLVLVSAHASPPLLEHIGALYKIRIQIVVVIVVGIAGSNCFIQEA